TNVTLTLSKFTHERIGDVSMLLVSPAKLGVVIFSGVGGDRDIHGVTVHLTDASSTRLPKDSDLWSEPLNPADYAVADAFAGAPIGPYGPVAFATFNGLTANGDWSLFVYDDRSPSHGQVIGGWSLMIATSLSTPTISFITNVITSAGTPVGP